MPEYESASFEPPAPVARVFLQNPEASVARQEVTMLLDTGADVSCVPRWAAQALGVQPAAGVRFEVLSFEGTRGFAEAVALEMLFLGRPSRSVPTRRCAVRNHRMQRAERESPLPGWPSLGVGRSQASLIGVHPDGADAPLRTRRRGPPQTRDAQPRPRLPRAAVGRYHENSYGAPLAQLDRATDYESVGQRFESSGARHP